MRYALEAMEIMAEVAAAALVTLSIFAIIVLWHVLWWL